MNAPRVLLVMLLLIAAACATNGPGGKSDSDVAGDGAAWILPYSKLDGSTVTIFPAGLTFALPEAWLENYRSALQTLDERSSGNKLEDPDFGTNWVRNLCLTREEIASVESNGGYVGKINDGYEWNFEYASVLNAIFNYRDCGFVGGRLPWNVAETALYLRVYIVQNSAANIGMRLEGVGARAVARVISRNSALTRARLVEVLENVSTEKEIAAEKPVHGVYHGWDSYAYRFPLSFGDYGGDATVQVFVKQFGEYSAIFAFMGSDPEYDQEAPDKIIDSVRWASPATPSRRIPLQPSPLYSTEEGNTEITIRPAGPTFEIPLYWSNYDILSRREKTARKNGTGNPNSEYKYEWARSLCLTREELEAVEYGYDWIHLHTGYKRYWEYATILNAVFDYDYCGFAGGDLPWGAPPQNIQMRMYVIPAKALELEQRLDTIGAWAVARTVFYNQATTRAASAAALERSPTLEEIIKYKPTREVSGSWGKSTFEFPLWDEDGSEVVRIEIYIKQFGDYSVVAAFLGRNPQREIDRFPDPAYIILHSLRWNNPPGGG